jgi:hypothetical protein
MSSSIEWDPGHGLVAVPELRENARLAGQRPKMKPLLGEAELGSATAACGPGQHCVRLAVHQTFR